MTTKNIATYSSKTPEGSDNVFGFTSSYGFFNFNFNEIKTFVKPPLVLESVDTNAVVGGDKTVSSLRGEDTLDIQSKRDAADFSHLIWGGEISSFEDVGGGSVKAYYSDGNAELSNGDSVTLDGIYAGVYVVFNVITDVEDSFEFIAVWDGSETTTWTSTTMYDKLRPNENKNDNSWSLEAQIEFFAESYRSITLGSRCKALEGWGGDWSSCIWGIIAGFQNIGGGKGTSIFGNNNIGENYWTNIFGNHCHVTDWSQNCFGSWNMMEGGDGLCCGSKLNNYGWKLLNIGSDSSLAGNESLSVGFYNTTLDAFGITLNELPDALHNRFNVNIGKGNIIGTESDLGDRSTGSITSFADAGTIKPHIIVTSVDHGLVTGDAISISATTSYNKKYSVTVIDSSTFRIKETFVPGDTTGLWSQNYTINSAITIGSDLTIVADGAVAVGANITNSTEGSIEFGISDDAKLSIGAEGYFSFPSASTVEPTLALLRVGHSRDWYDENEPKKLWRYRNNGGVLEKNIIGGGFVIA